MTIHDNEVLFYTGKDVQMEFKETNKVITDGQGFDEKTPLTLEAMNEEKSIWKLMEKPNKFDPFGQKELTLLATI